jgi:chromosome segregation ATPase
MNTSGSFTDLRLNQQEGQNQESFWPSFTDIMTVILMIFMIAMVVLLLRNMELVKQLRATMQAEREAMELARSTGEEKEDLALKLIAAENELSMLRIQQMRLNEENQQQRSTLGGQAEQIARLKAQNEALTLNRDQLAAEKLTLSQRLQRSENKARALQENQKNLQQDLASIRRQLDNARQELSQLQESIGNLQNLQETTQQQLASLSERYNKQSEELQAARRAERTSGLQLSKLQGKYDDLQVKYNELFRPARSPEGRYLVEVRYSKRNGKAKIEFATADQPEFQVISRKQLTLRLEKLKKEKKNGLYVKVIFPDKSGLTYNEAWSFTADLHAKYDYYSQESTATPTVPTSNEEATTEGEAE